MINSILDFLFPKRCVGCNKNGTYFCHDCIQQIEQRDLICPQCSRPAIGGITHPLCHKRYGMDGLWTLGAYKDGLKSAIQKLKYRFVSDLASTLININIEYWSRFGSSLVKELKAEGGGRWVIVPVPLHPARQNWRGFNQSALLAKLLASKTGLTYADFLIKHRNTPAQAHLSREERLKNNLGAFDLKNMLAVKDLYIILVDDVWTTGSTLRECAKVLKRAGAKKVWGFTLAR